MKITVEKVDDINFILRGTVDNSVIKEKIAKLKEEAAKDPDHDASVDQKIEQEAAGQVFTAFISEGVKEAGVDVETLLGQPGIKKYEQQGDTVYIEAELSTSPQIDVDVEYMDVVPSFTKPEADPKAVEEKLIEFATKQAEFSPIDTPRAVEEGDVTVIDFTGYLDGKPFEGGSAEKFNLKIGSNSFIPGFEEQIIGMEYGEERTIKVTFPENYSSADLAGKETEFLIKLHEIQEQKAEKTDDAFAQRILNDTTATLDTLKEKLADQITSQELSHLYMTELKPKIVEGLLSKFDFTLPNNIVEQEIDAKVRDKIQMMTPEDQKRYIEDKEKFLALRDSVREEAKATIKAALITEALAKKEGIDVHEQEVISALTYQAMMSGQDAQALVQYYQENNLMNSAKLALIEDKLFGKMLGFDK